MAMSLITIYCKRGEQPWRCQEFSALIPNPPMHALIKDYMVQGGSELSQGLATARIDVDFPLQRGTLSYGKNQESKELAYRFCLPVVL